MQADGKILLGGQFHLMGGQTRNNIAGLNADGTLDLVFNPNANATIFSIVVQPDGKILVGGGFNSMNSIGGKNRDYIARLDATTGAADSFDPHANSGDVLAIAVQTDGKVLVGGDFTFIVGQNRNRIARIVPAPPTAAGVSLSGRVLTPEGSGLRNAQVVLTDMQGVKRRAITSSFGYYRFDDVLAGETYVIGVASKLYTFSPRTISVFDELTDVDLVVDSVRHTKPIVPAAYSDRGRSGK